MLFERSFVVLVVLSATSIIVLTVVLFRVVSSRLPLAVNASANKSAAFSRQTTKAEQETMLAILRDVTDELDAANITYWLTDGSLIGAHRHHTIIPWDDDLDIRLRWSDRHQLGALYESRLSARYGLHRHREDKLKLYPLNGTHFTRLVWSFPFIDVWFADEDSTHVWCVESTDVVHRRATVYPLRRRPFGNMSLWTPRDVASYLRLGDVMNTCTSPSWSHKFERGIWPEITVACRELWPYLPFVFRNESGNNGTIVEVLRVGDRVLSTVELDADRADATSFQPNYLLSTVIPSIRALFCGLNVLESLIRLHFARS